MKVVDSPVTYGFNNEFIPSNVNQDSATVVSPANFSGPEHLREFVGRCFNFTDVVYMYTFCPFHNVTQNELSNRWNGYHGVLGVWQEWKIVNNTFSSMLMLEGDKCGELFRSVEIVFRCNDTEGVVEVTEPSKCTYLLVFATPKACHSTAFLVYPNLSPDEQLKWNRIESEFAEELLTPQGYDAELQQLFIESGLKRKSQETNAKVKNDQSENDALSDGNQCMRELEELRNEVEGLRLLLELKSASVTNTKSQRV